jgi:hypothetical protein
MSYQQNNAKKTNELENIAFNIQNGEDIYRKQSYPAIIIESERLLKREETFFIISTIINVGLLITLFQVI